MLNLERPARIILEEIAKNDNYCAYVHCESCPLHCFDCINWAQNRDGAAQSAREFLEAIDEHNAKQGAQND